MAVVNCYGYVNEIYYWCTSVCLRVVTPANTAVTGLAIFAACTNITGTGVYYSAPGIGPGIQSYMFCATNSPTYFNVSVIIPIATMSTGTTIPVPGTIAGTVNYYSDSSCTTLISSDSLSTANAHINNIFGGGNKLALNVGDPLAYAVFAPFISTTFNAAVGPQLDLTTCGSTLTVTNTSPGGFGGSAVMTVTA